MRPALLEQLREALTNWVITPVQTEKRSACQFRIAVVGVTRLWRNTMAKERKIIVHIATSADGYIARPDGDLDWLTAGSAMCPSACGPCEISQRVWCNFTTTCRNRPRLRVRPLDPSSFATDCQRVLNGYWKVCRVVNIIIVVRWCAGRESSPSSLWSECVDQGLRCLLKKSRVRCHANLAAASS